MIDITIFLNSIKSNWIKRVINEPNKGLWKEIIKRNINHLGGCFLFKCNINSKDILKFQIKNNIYKKYYYLGAISILMKIQTIYPNKYCGKTLI